MIYNGDLKPVFEGSALSQYSLNNDLHEQVLCFIHSLDSDALARLFVVGADDSLTLYIPSFRASVARSDIEDFCRSLEDFLSSLGGATFAVAPYEEYMKEALEKIDCSLIFEAE